MMNWEKLAKERGEEIVALNTQLQAALEEYNKIPDDVWIGTNGITDKVRWLARRADSSDRTISRLHADMREMQCNKNSTVFVTGPELNDMENMRSHGQKVEPAMLMLMAWLIRGRYRTLQHQHNGFYQATDEANGDEWNADSAVGLAEMMTERVLQ